MKTLLAVLLLLSVAGNVVIGCLLFREPPVTAIPAADPNGNAAVRGFASAGGNATAIAQAWRELQTDDVEQLTARLRAAGFPSDVLRSIVAAQLHEQFIARRDALLGARPVPSFWKNAGHDPQTLAMLNELNREEQKTLRAILGADADVADADALSGRNHDFLPPEKARALQDVIRQHEEKRAELFSSGVVSSVDQGRILAHENALRDAIAGVLTPAELTEYDLRTSRTANRLRSELNAFNPTEEEFRKLFHLRQPFDEIYNPPNIDPVAMTAILRQRTEAQTQLTAQIKAALSPERAAEYEMTTDSSYRQTSQLVSRLELPPETTRTVFAIQKEMQQMLQPIQMNRSLSLEERNQRLAALAAETQARITNVLGSRGFEAYRQYGGSWMQALQPRTPPAAAGRSGRGGGGGGIGGARGGG